MLGSCGTTFENDKKWKTSLFSATAHSALIIENSNPFYLKDKDQKINCRRYKKNGGEVIQSVHYGYKNRYSAICSRTIELGNNGKNFAVLDQVYSEKLLNFAIRKKIPLLGICRGMQVINLFFKGSLKKVKNHIRTQNTIVSVDKKNQKKIKCFHRNGIKTLGLNLNELYKSGALTKEEFSKAKKKLLN